MGNVHFKDCFYVVDGYCNEDVRFNAGSKARDDIERILNRSGIKPLRLSHVSRDNTLSKILDKSPFKKIWKNLILARSWNDLLREADGKIVIFQYPVNQTSAFLPFILKWRKRNGLNVVILVHDLVMSRFTMHKSAFISGLWNSFKERVMLDLSDATIVHNPQMADFVQEHLALSSSSLVSLGLFDYLVDDDFRRAEPSDPNMPVAIAGNLSPEKAGYLSHLPDSIAFNLYGDGFSHEGSSNTFYKGKVPPEKLPSEIVGSFGLVWDGPETATCSGVYGSYLKINNPHKTSLYLAAGLPVIAWSGAAVAHFITENGLGITVESLAQLHSKISELSVTNYNDIVANVQEIGARLRSGSMTLHAIEAAVSKARSLR